MRIDHVRCESWKEAVVTAPHPCVVADRVYHTAGSAVPSRRSGEVGQVCVFAVVVLRRRDQIQSRFRWAHHCGHGHWGCVLVRIDVRDGCHTCPPLHPLPLPLPLRWSLPLLPLLPLLPPLRRCLACEHARSHSFERVHFAVVNRWLRCTHSGNNHSYDQHLEGYRHLERWGLL